jgi:hypothetical protein
MLTGIYKVDVLGLIYSAQFLQGSAWPITPMWACGKVREAETVTAHVLSC